MSNTNSNIDWDDVIKKEARGSGDEDLGEVQEVGGNYVLVQRGIVNKEKFYIPRDLAESYDGDVLRFRVSEEDAKSRFLRDSPPPTSSESTYERGSPPRREGTEQETTVPLTEEKLNVSKRTSEQQATIKKEPVTETKTVEVPVTHEELTVERRPASSTTTPSDIGPVESETETTIPLRQEEVQVTKQPYVKEEVTIKKKPVTETRTVSDEVRSEKVKVGDTDEVTEQDE
jgi:uncharacterized protein (TIGR02271 family)